MHDDHDTDHSQTDLTTNPKDNSNNGDIDIETDILQLTGEDLESTYPNNRYFGQVHENFEIPAREEQTVPAGDVLPPKIAQNLEFNPWSHQAEALQVLDRGDNVCVAAGTSSGKTLVYGLHIARQYLEDPETRSLIVYPTKALSRDQEQELNEFLRNTLGLDISVGVYDGDTKSEEKSRIRDECNVVITNFVGLNQYLESHHLWADFHLELLAGGYRRSPHVDWPRRDARRLDPPTRPADHRLLRRRSAVRSHDGDDWQSHRTRSRTHW